MTKAQSRLVVVPPSGKLADLMGLYVPAATQISSSQEEALMTNCKSLHAVAQLVALAAFVVVADVPFTLT
jgi:hypothetical protein